MNRRFEIAKSLLAAEEGRILALLGVLLVMIFAGLGLGFFLLGAESERLIAKNFIEREPPLLEMTQAPQGIGLEEVEIKLDVADSGAGLDEIIVRAEQDGEETTIYKKFYEERVVSDQVTIKFKGKEQGLFPGETKLEVSVFDRSFWSNGTKKSFGFNVDYERPRLQVVSIQHNAVIGGSELVFFRIQDSDVDKSGVKVGNNFFPGYPASAVDGDFAAIPTLYVAFFGVPLSFSGDKDDLVAAVWDRAGNNQVSSFYYRVRSAKFPSRLRPITREYLEAKGVELYKKWRKISPESPAKLSHAELLKKLLEDYARDTEARLVEILKSSQPKRLWDGVFLRQPYVARADFGDRRQYTLDEQGVAVMTTAGVEFSAKAGDSVIAANKGEIIYAGELGTLGNTVIIDHGLGFATVYSYLAKATVAVGQSVQRGSSIGTVGASGIADLPMLYFQLRLNGLPVRPVEWWDPTWVRDHVEAKFAEVKMQLGVGSSDSVPVPQANEELDE